MLAAVFFLLFWIVVALVLFFIALRGGPRGARASLQTQSRGGRKFATFAFIVIYIGLGIAVPTVLLTGNHDNASAQVAGFKLTPAAKEGRTLFGEHCAVCHTLKAAQATGQVGPDLDQLAPSKQVVLQTVINGIQRGNGTMPAGIVQGKDANAVAAFVSETAGK